MSMVGGTGSRTRVMVWMPTAFLPLGWWQRPANDHTTTRTRLLNRVWGQYLSLAPRRSIHEEAISGEGYGAEMNVLTYHICASRSG